MSEHDLYLGPHPHLLMIKKISSLIELSKKRIKIDKSERKQDVEKCYISKIEIAIYD